jgi:hypothetical protein
MAEGHGPWLAGVIRSLMGGFAAAGEPVPIRRVEPPGGRWSKRWSETPIRHGIAVPVRRRPVVGWRARRGTTGRSIGALMGELPPAAGEPVRLYVCFDRKQPYGKGEERRDGP